MHYSRYSQGIPKIRRAGVAGRALLATLTDCRGSRRRDGRLSAFGNDPSRKPSCAPRRRQSVPRPAKGRRYADAPAAAFLTGFVAGELSSLRSA